MKFEKSLFLHSIDENDELISDTEEVPEKREQRQSTRAYKDLKKKVPATKPKPTQKTIKKPSPTKRLQTKRKHRSSYTVLDSGKISLRHSTALKSAATQHRVKERKEAMRKRAKSYRIVDVMPTQKELLAEAETTAKENLASLERFKRMEIEKKKVRPTKRISTGPIVRYHSLSMPAIGENKMSTGYQRKRNSSSIMNLNGEMTMDMEIESSNNKIDQRSGEVLLPSRRVERTFITFENDVNDEFFTSIFNKANAKSKTEAICPLTRLPAKYIDPLTKIPYRNVQALKIIREAYYQLVETSNAAGTESWIQWRRKMKENATKSE